MKKIIFSIILISIILGLVFLAYNYLWIPKKIAEAKTFIDESQSKMNNINSLKYQLVLLSGGKTISTSDIWIKREDGEQKIRSENSIIGSENKTITLWGSKEHLFYMYDSSRKKGRGGKVDYEPAGEGSNYSFTEGFNMLKEHSPRIIGKESIDGKECIIIETTTEGIKTKNWIWIEYGIPIKSVSPVTTLGGKIDKSRQDESTRKDIEVNTIISDEIFKLPSDIQISPS